MKKILFIYLLIAVGMLTSCDYHKRECVAKATRCLTDESYKDYLGSDKDSLVDSVYSILQEQRLILMELSNGLKNVSVSNGKQQPAQMAQIIEKNQYADVVQNDESAETVVADSPKTEIAPSEGNGWGKKLAIGGTVLGAAAVGAVLADKFSCPRMSIVDEYRMMAACVYSCGESMVEKCGEAIREWICKDKESIERILSRTRNSCSIR